MLLMTKESNSWVSIFFWVNDLTLDRHFWNFPSHYSFSFHCVMISFAYEENLYIFNTIIFSTNWEMFPTRITDIKLICLIDMHWNYFSLMYKCCTKHIKVQVNLSRKNNTKLCCSHLLRNWQKLYCYYSDRKYLIEHRSSFWFLFKTY